MLQMAAPDLEITGEASATFSYIPSHIEYVMTELLKNAFRATAEAHLRYSLPDLPPVSVTIAKSDRAPVITMRVRDAGGGIPPDIVPRVNSYAFTTVSQDESSSVTQQEDDAAGPYGIQNAGGGVGVDEISGLQSHTGHLAGLGFGLPLSKLHCEAWEPTFGSREKADSVL